ncbi:MAG: hypothetical protein GC168_18570 [Candidatus Hydrogenedens sp.]|nr:hypothetical protein [Candidatus Hydrogenedens sp.]
MKASMMALKVPDMSCDRSQRTASSMRVSLLATLLAGASLLALAVPALAASPTTEPAPAVLDSHAQEVLRTVLIQLSQNPDARTRDRLPLLDRLLQNRQTKRKDLVGRQITPLSRREALRQGLERNLSLAIGGQDPDRAQEALRQVKAVFDPIFDLQIGYNYATSFKRTKVGLVTLKTFTVNGNVADFTASQPSAVLFNIPGSNNATGRTVVALEFYNNAATNGGQQINDAITANPGNTFGHPKQQITYTLGLTQELPWGGTLTLTDKTVQQEVFYRANGSWDDRQFTTNLSGSLVTAVPFGRGFGEDNPNNAAIRSGQVARERADWEYKALVNQTMRDIDLTYLETIRRIEALKNTVDNQALIGQLRGRMNRLFDQGLGTRYQKAQLDNEYAKTGVRVEQALQDYINASVALGQLIGDPDAIRASAIYLPYAEGAELNKETPFRFETVMATAKQSRPDFYVTNLNRSLSEINLALAQNQARPDIQVSAAVTSGQNGSVIGYENPAQSHGRIFRPDNLNQSYGVTYTYPWLNRGRDAAVERSQFALEVSDVGVRDTETQVRTEITNGLTVLQSARARQRYNADQAKGLNAAVGSLQRRLEVGIVSEDELINTSRQLLDAQLARISAAIDAKQAETSLLYAQGTIGAALVGGTSPTTAEKRRLELLADAGHLSYFGPAKDQSHGKAGKK